MRKKQLIHSNAFITNILQIDMIYLALIKIKLLNLQKKMLLLHLI